MIWRNFFSRAKKNNVATLESETQDLNSKITCDTQELKDFVTSWTKNVGSNFELFAEFLELVGIKTPVKLSNYDEKNKSFKCVTDLNREVHISLFFGCFPDDCPEICITEGEETKRYYADSNYKEKLPIVKYYGRTIKKDGKELETYYYESFFDRILKLDNSHKLKVDISKSSYNTDNPEFSLLTNQIEIDNYLLGLDNSLVTDEVYEKIIDFMNFSDEEISSCKILISYIETVNEEEQVRSIIRLSNGKMKEYAILENGNTYHVFDNGNWEFISDRGVKITYTENTKKFVFFADGSEEDIVTINPREIFSHAKAKNSDLFKFVK